MFGRKLLTVALAPDLTSFRDTAIRPEAWDKLDLVQEVEATIRRVLRRELSMTIHTRPARRGQRARFVTRTAPAQRHY